jgi:hypothetical protein
LDAALAHGAGSFLTVPADDLRKARTKHPLVAVKQPSRADE